MKLRLIALLLCLAMIFSLSLTLVSCGGGDEGGDDTGEVGGGGNDGGNTDGGNTDGGNTGNEGGNTDGGNTGNEGGNENKPEPLPPHTVVESYLPYTVSTALYDNFAERKSTNGYAALMKSSGTVAYLDTATISDCRIVSITIPVYKVTAAKDGMHTFTLHKVKSSAAGLVKAPVASYKLVLDAEDYGLPTTATNNLCSVITVNLMDYNIVLGSNETLAFTSSDDTIIPAYLKDGNYPMDKVRRELIPESSGSFIMVGDTTKDSYKAANYSLCFDLEIARTYENVNVYNALVAEQTQYKAVLAVLKQLYAGKKISILGDSISTYRGISNDGKANSTTSGHAVYYPDNDNSFSSYTETYWGRLMTDLGMGLCVNNSWGGARVMGKYSTNLKDSMTYRATELDRDDGTQPDVIISYMGINDIKDDTIAIGTLYNILENKLDQRSEEARVAAWFAEVLAGAGSMPYQREHDYTNFDEAYALGLYTMRQKYPNAEIYCMTYLYNHSGEHSPVRINQANRVVKAIANYLGVTVIDQSGEFSAITNDNVHCYGTINADLDCIHLSATGHKKMEETILKTMAKKNGLI